MKEKKGNNKKFVCIQEHFIYSGSPTIFMQSENIIFKDRIERKFDRAEIALFSNSSWNLKYCIEVAKYFLDLSSKESVKKLTNKKPSFFENMDRYEDFIRAIEHRFLLPSLLFYNASFDYLCIFVYSLLTARKEIVESKETKKERVQNKMDYLNLSDKKHSWMFALNSLITQNKKIRKPLVKKIKRFFYSDFIKILNELKVENKKLRIDYYANIIKHQQIPFFKPKCLHNVFGAKSFVDINQFYSIDELTPSIISGIPETVLDIEKTQKFLIQYHNITVRIFNYLLKKIFIDQREQHR